MAKASVPVSAAVAAAAATTTVSGFQIGVIAFIPIDPKDLRKQAEIPMLLLDIQEGRKSLADLAPYLKQVEFRQQHVRKRVPVDEARDLFTVAKEGEADPDEEEDEATVRDGETGELVEDNDD